MQFADWMREEQLTLAQVADGINASNGAVVQRYRDGTRIPDRARMQAIVIMSEGRVTPNDIYGLDDLIQACLERRMRRLSRRRPHSEAQAELPLIGPQPLDAELLLHPAILHQAHRPLSDAEPAGGAQFPRPGTEAPIRRRHVRPEASPSPNPPEAA